MKRTRFIIFALALVAAILSVGLSDTPPAAASATGCTAAPGNLGALNCIYVDGSGLDVNYTDSIYNSGTPALNVCNPQGKWRWTADGTSSYRYTYRSATTCGWWRGWVSWTPGLYDHFKDGLSLCATQKNSIISSYPNYACVTVHS